MIRFTVPGVPIAMPRQRHRVVAVAGGRSWVHNYTPATAPVQSYKATVRMAAFAAYDGPLLAGPVEVEALLLFPRPRRLIWKTRPMPREPHTSRPDAENVMKAILDSLTGQLWTDDSQVCDVVIRKRYASGQEQPATEITVKALNWRMRGCN